MLRRALTPRWLIAGIALLLLTAIAIQLGRWQWDRTQLILTAERAAVAEAVDVGDLLPDGSYADGLPDEVIGRPVTATGVYDGQLQTRVVNRSLDGNAGQWLVTGLRLDDGRTLAVVRGWISDEADPATAVPSGDLVVSGVIHPDEEFYSDAVTPPGTTATISSAQLSEAWNTELLPGFVMLSSQSPSVPPAPLPVPPTVKALDVPFPFQNFFYAIQWWVFAAFGWVVYFRWLWLDTRRLH